LVATKELELSAKEQKFIVKKLHRALPHRSHEAIIGLRSKNEE